MLPFLDPGLNAHLDATVLAAAQANPDVGYLVDAPYPDAPLVITFGFVSWDDLPKFDFVRRLQKLEASSGRGINQIMIRDTANFWYQHGVSGLGRDVDGVALALRRIIAQLQPASVSTLGQSMGAYAAVLFGALLGADQVLAFGPLSYFRSDWAQRDGDTRWLATMEKLDRFAPARHYDDLPGLLASLPRIPATHLVYGTGPEAGEEFANFDALHAARYEGIPGVDVHIIPEANHAVVEWLIKMKLIDTMLSQLLLPDKARKRRAAGPKLAKSRGQAEFRDFDDGWRTWIAENLALKANQEQLLRDLMNQGFHAGEAQREIDKAVRSPYLIDAERYTKDR